MRRQGPVQVGDGTGALYRREVSARALYVGHPLLWTDRQTDTTETITFTTPLAGANKDRFIIMIRAI